MKKPLFAALLLLIAGVPGAWASMSGVETVAGGGLHASNTFVSPFTWSVTKNGDNTWTYDYRYRPSSTGRGVTFINLEIGGTPTLAGTSTVAATSNVNYLDPALSTKSPAYSQWVTGGSGSNQSWTTYNYSDLTYLFQYNTTYSTADPATLDKAVPILSQVGTIDRRPNSFTSNLVTFGGSPTPQFQAGTATEGNVTTTMQGLTWFLPSQEYGVPQGSGTSAGGGREPGTVRGYNAGWELTLTTAAAPMWGDFFLDGGDWKSDGKYLQATNAGYDGTAPVFVYLDGQALNETGFIATPNFTTLATPTPIPPAFLLFGSGVFSLLGFRLRKRG